jgi:hypothetical protein
MVKAKIFFLKLLIIGSTILILDQGLGKLLKHYYYKIDHAEQGRATYAIDLVRDDILILGSSRASHHYIPTIISDSLGISCYNAGKDKQGLFYCQAVLNAAMKRHVPKLVILDFSPNSFEKTEMELDELSVLLPYYRNHPEIQSIVNKRSKWEWIKTHSSLYCYNSLALQIIFNNISNQRDANETNGYVPLGNKENILVSPSDLYPIENNPEKKLITVLKDLINITKLNKCKLIVVVSPIYYSLANSTKDLELAKNICSQENITYFDYSQSAAFINNGPALFSDKQHLNNTGAALFSQTLCSDIKNVFNSSNR